jgi:hypothetical protein
MKRHMIISLAIIAIVIATPFVANAAGLTRSFGGRILSTTIPLVTCSGIGPTTLSNFSGMSLYTTNFAKTPKAGDWILGRVNIIPEYTSCQIQVGTYKIPYGVRDSSYYGLSGGSSFGL